MPMYALGGTNTTKYGGPTVFTTAAYVTDFCWARSLLRQIDAYRVKRLQTFVAAEEPVYLDIIIQMKFCDVQFRYSYSLKDCRTVISIVFEFFLVDFTTPCFNVQREEVRFDNPCSMEEWKGEM